MRERTTDGCSCTHNQNSTGCCSAFPQPPYTWTQAHRPLAPLWCSHCTGVPLRLAGTHIRSGSPLRPQNRPGLFQQQGKLKARPGPTGGALRTAVPYKRNGGTTPLDPCACERNAQRGNTRRRAAYTWCCPATESLARVALTPAAKKAVFLKKSRAAKEAGGGGRGSGGSDDAGVAVGDGTDVADRIPSPPRFVWRSPAAVRAVGKVPDVRAIRVPTGKGDV